MTSAFRFFLFSGGRKEKKQCQITVPNSLAAVGADDPAGHAGVLGGPSPGPFHGGGPGSFRRSAPVDLIERRRTDRSDGKEEAGGKGSHRARGVAATRLRSCLGVWEWK